MGCPILLRSARFEKNPEERGNQGVKYDAVVYVIATFLVSRLRLFYHFAQQVRTAFPGASHHSVPVVEGT